MYLEANIKAIDLMREKAGLSKFALSRKAGLGKYAIERLNLHSCHHLRALAIADALGCTVNEIFKAPEKIKFKKASSI